MPGLQESRHRVGVGAGLDPVVAWHGLATLDGRWRTMMPSWPFSTMKGRSIAGIAGSKDG